jgi:hypothetical protein
VQGNPPPSGECFASVSYCRHYRWRAVTVILVSTLAKAQELLDTVNITGCGGTCTGRHRIYKLGE